MKTFIEVLHERRKILQNPYAFLDELVEHGAVKQDRFRLENPYAHIDDVIRSSQQVQRFDGIAGSTKAPPQGKRRRRSDTQLEEYVREIQMGLWERRQELLGTAHTDPIAILDPAVALRAYGFQVVSVESLGQFASSEGMFEVAGSIDKRQKLVQISAQFSRDIQTFTLAHEFGHALLHEATGLHRDRGLDGTYSVRDPDEREANRFATFFLMPSKQVRRAFEERFGSPAVRFDERATFGRVRKNADIRRMAARRLASMTQYNGSSFTSLADHFHVSVEAMAIRLEELKLFVLAGNLSA